MVRAWNRWYCSLSSQGSEGGSGGVGYFSSKSRLLWWGIFMTLQQAPEHSVIIQTSLNRVAFLMMHEAFQNNRTPKHKQEAEE